MPAVPPRPCRDRHDPVAGGEQQRRVEPGRADPAEPIDDELLSRTDELEKSELEDPRYRMRDRFEWPLGLGLSLLLLSVLVDVLWFRRVP